MLWLIPLAALARPKWRDFLIWQACEVAYFLGIWMYLAYTTSGDAHKGLPRRVPVRDRRPPAGHAVPLRRDRSATSSCRNGTSCAWPARTIPRGASWTAREDVFVLGAAAHPPRHAAHFDGPQVEWGSSGGGWTPEDSSL